MDSSGANLAPGGDSLQIVVSSASFSDPTHTSSNVNLSDTVGNGLTYDFPSALTSGTYTIPWTSFVASGTGTFDFGSVGQVQFQTFWDSGNAPFNGAVTNFISFDSIQVVPEPTQMVFVAGVGAALGLWRMRTLRRTKHGSDATAG